MAKKKEATASKSLTLVAVYVNKEQLVLIDKAASFVGLSRSGYLRSAGLASAHTDVVQVAK